MSGFDNEVLYAVGERLEPSDAQAISIMQQTSTDVSRINYTGNPEGIISANPSSLCHDPVSGNIYRKATGTGNTGWVLTTQPTPSSKITVYDLVDSGSTWIKDPATIWMELFMWNPGAGGGGGRKGASGTSGGGSGGSAGQAAYYSGYAFSFPDNALVIIGSGGVGGASQTVDGTNGNPGLSGGISSFGDISLVASNPGQGGGTGSVGAGQSVGTKTNFSVADTGGALPGGGGSGSNTVGGTSARNSSTFSPTGGGGGGGADSTTQRTGTAGGAYVSGATTLLAGGTAGLESTGINGGNGTSPTNLSPGSPTGLIAAGTGGGGGGGYSVGANGATAGGNGGNGAVPGGGGGGGGGGLNGVANSGAGGNGGDGRIVVIEYF